MALAVYIPLYNEIGSFDVINLNIHNLKKIFQDVKITIRDNCSTDGTWEELGFLKKKYPFLKVIQNHSNIGFSKNLALLDEDFESNDLVMLLGANDTLSTFGLRNLKRCIEENGTADLFISNWTYITNTKKPKLIHNGDVDTYFQGTSLDDFFQVANVPIGIMQYVVRYKLLANMKFYIHLDSPQVGMFLNSFPCKFVTVGNPPLAYVRHVEGWRSSNENILRVHLKVVKEILVELYKLNKTQVITDQGFSFVSRKYLRILLSLLFNLLLRNAWAGSEGGRIDRIKLFFVKSREIKDLYENYRKLNLVFYMDFLEYLIRLFLSPIEKTYLFKPLSWFYRKFVKGMIYKFYC